MEPNGRCDRCGYTRTCHRCKTQVLKPPKKRVTRTSGGAKKQSTKSVAKKK